MTAPAPVLIVDDLEFLRDMVETFLGEMKHKAVSVASIGAAKKWLGANVPPLIILDVMLPDGNGLDMCLWIRSQPRLEKTPILVMTAIKDDETFRDALEMGAMDYVSKPIDFETFKNKVERFLSDEKFPSP
jgi:DNA-binding response OmpR family regulator